jgi:putative glutamate/gamma-aminobutyrate antiporter
MSAEKPNVKLSVFTLMMINVAAILSLRALPGLAEYGYALIFYLALAAICFFVPSALVSAELASGWPQEGGVYLWVKEAFGPRWGFVAIFMQWAENLPWFPTVLAFAASACAYIFHPPLAESRLFVVVFIWITLWAGTLLNFRGMKLSSFLSSSGVLSGTIIPGILIVILGIAHVAAGRPNVISFSFDALIPRLGNLDQLMLLATMLISFTGMEMSAAHVNEVHDPARNYPRAIFAACLIILTLSVFGSLSIALVMPADKLSLSAGVSETFAFIFDHHGMPWMTSVISLLMAYGAITMVITWMVGPSKGIRQVAREGYLPKMWQRTNREGMPTNILIIQTVFSSIFSLVILFMPTVSSAFVFMSAAAAQLYLIMYLLMFAAAIRLRYTHAHVNRTYRIPGGNLGMWFVSGMAIISGIFVFIFGFIPTRSVRELGLLHAISYVIFLLGGCLLMTGIPLFFYHRAVKNGDTQRATETKGEIV